MKYFVVCPRGLESVLADELTTISQYPEIKKMGDWVIDAPGGYDNGGVSLAAPLTATLAINLHSRIASRCLLQLTTASYRKEDDVYKAVKFLSWEEWMKIGRAHV